MREYLYKIQLNHVNGDIYGVKKPIYVVSRSKPEALEYAKRIVSHPYSPTKVSRLAERVAGNAFNGNII